MSRLTDAMCGVSPPKQRSGNNIPSSKPSIPGIPKPKENSGANQFFDICNRNSVSRISDNLPKKSSSASDLSSPSSSSNSTSSFTTTNGQTSPEPKTSPIRSPSMPSLA